VKCEEENNDNSWEFKVMEVKVKLDNEKNVIGQGI